MKRTIFIIDDDNDILEALEIFFKEAGFKVYTSFEGSGIENKTIRFKPDVILLDLLLSGNDGSEITLGLKSNERTKNIPVLLISAHPKANEKALKSGADGFLAKPFDLNELLRIVRTLLKEQALTTSPSSTG